MNRAALFFLLAFGGCASRTTAGSASSAAAPAKETQAEVVVRSDPVAEAWRKERPRARPMPSAKPPAIKASKIDSGLTVISVKQRPWPLVELALVTKGGSSLDPPTLHGLTLMTYESIRGGGRGMTRWELAKELNRIGAVLETRVTPTEGRASITGLAHHVDRMAQLLSAAVTQPMLDTDTIAERREAIAQLLNSSDGTTPRALVERLLPGAIYGASHPYGHSPYGTPESLRRIGVKDVRQHHHQYIVPRASAFIVAGDIDHERARTLAERNFGEWWAEPPPVHRISSIDVKKRRAVTIVHRDRLSQTLILIGRPLPGREATDARAMIVLNELLGGSPTARLHAIMREERGYTYSAVSRMELHKAAGAIIAEAAVPLAETKIALEDFLRIIESMHSDPPKRDEIDRARQLFALDSGGVFFERLEDGLAMAALRFVEDRPLDGRPLFDLASLTEQDIAGAAERQLDPSAMEIILVGDSSQLVPIVESLQLGRVSVLRP
jgi:predicted Zn-dependent peptidase